MNVENNANEKVQQDLQTLDQQIDELEQSDAVNPDLEEDSAPEAPATADNATETDAPPANIDDKLNQIDEDDKAAEEGKPKSEETTTPPEEVTPANDGGQGEKDKGKELLLTEEYVKSLNLEPDKANKLNKFLGKPISEALKSFAHAQTLIGKKKEELLSLDKVDKHPVNIPQINAQVTEKAQTPDEIAAAKDEIIYSELVKEFPELPKDPIERKAWLSTLNYEDRERADEYLDKKKAISRDIDEVWKQTEYLRQNHDKVIDKQIGDEITSISTYFVEKLGEDPKKFGYDLTLDANGNNELINSLLTDPDNPNDFDPNVVGKYNGVTLINKGALTKKFFELELPNIIKNLKVASRQEGYQARSDKQAAPGMIIQPGKGTIKGEITTDKIKEITNVDELDRMLDEEESK